MAVSLPSVIMVWIRCLWYGDHQKLIKRNNASDESPYVDGFLTCKYMYFTAYSSVNFIYYALIHIIDYSTVYTEQPRHNK